jgi:hypothetical protein
MNPRFSFIQLHVLEINSEAALSPSELGGCKNKDLIEYNKIFGCPPNDFMLKSVSPSALSEPNLKFSFNPIQ